MHSEIASTEKIETLRAFAGSNVPTSRLRSALFRAGGDINAAATILLTDGTVGSSEPILIPQQESQPVAQQVEQSTPKKTQETTQKDEQDARSTRKKDKVAHSQMRRKAWYTFYHEKYTEAVVTVGKEKTKIDQYIVGLWKSMGSKKRDEYTKRVADEAENEKKEEVTDEDKKSKEVIQNGNAKSEEAKSETVETRSETEAVKSSTQSKKEEINLSEQKKEQDVVQVELVQQPEPHKSPPKRQRTKTPPPIPQQEAIPFVKSREKNSNVEWPRKIASRLCRGSMLTTGKKVLAVGDELTLESPQHTGLKLGAKGKNRKNRSSSSAPSRIVRFLKDGRELGRLAPDISHALAPALQSGFLHVKCTVVQAPPVVRMFSEIYLDLSIHLLEEAFDGQKEQELAERGVATTATGNESEKPSAEQGVDTRRINVVHLITTLKLCEPLQSSSNPFQLAKKADDGDVGAVSEEAAEAYYRSVDAIDEKAAKGFEPPKNLACVLRDYQRVGVGWMVAREKYGSEAQLTDSSATEFFLNPLWKKRRFPDGDIFFMNTTTGGLSLEPPVANAGGPYGGILADEMGLGKTVQCIACIVKDMEDQIQEHISSPEYVAESEDDPIGEGVAPGGADNQASKSISSDDENRETSKRNRKRFKIEFDDENESPSVDGVDDVPLKEEQSCSLPNNTRGSESRHENTRQRASQILNDDKYDDDDDDFVLDGDESNEDKEQSDDNDDDEDYTPGKSPTNRKSQTAFRDKVIPHRKRKRSSSAQESAFKVLMSRKHSNLIGGTLIVCPTSLVTQWTNELHLHVKPRFLRVMTHYGQGRGDTNSISIVNADVVVTTYGILASESPDEKDGIIVGHPGPLMQIKWRRVVLDEAHTIKSRTTTWARAAYQLQAERRWCLTGTVIHNHINDVFSLLHFLQVKPWSSWAFWNRGIVSNIESKDVSSQTAAMSLVRDIISSVTLRRKKTTKDSTGKCIVQLTKKTVDIVSLEPSPEERDFYSALHSRTKTQFDAFLAQGKVMRNYASVLELLLRLRQACDHPYLVFAAAPSKDSVVMKDKDKLFKQFLQAGSSSQYVEQVFQDAENGVLDQSRTCPVCLDMLDDPVAPKECGHPACRICLHEAVQRAKKCPVCRIETTVESITTLPRTSRFSVNLKQKWRSSAKIDAMLGEVKERQVRRMSQKKAIGKTVIFSQFTSMLDLVGFALEKEKLHSIRIDGSVPQAQRAVILEQFATEKEMTPGAANILLVSLRAGGVGLNLVSASHAILLDIHWNPQVDAQAQDRIHRHGQTRDVLIRRYIIKDTVEEKLLQVQDRKQHIADGALDVATEEDKKQARLSELKLLFSST